MNSIIGNNLDFDTILVGDMFYDEEFANFLFQWLRRLASEGKTVSFDLLNCSLSNNYASQNIFTSFWKAHYTYLKQSQLTPKNKQYSMQN